MRAIGFLVLALGPDRSVGPWVRCGFVGSRPGWYWRWRAPRRRRPTARARARRPAPPAPLRIDFIAVGQGDAALVTSPTGKTVLIDGGPKQAGPALTALLRARGATAIDLMLLTHPHADHLGGLAAIVRTFPVRTFMAAPFQHEASVRAAAEGAEARKVTFAPRSAAARSTSAAARCSRC